MKYIKCSMQFNKVHVCSLWSCAVCVCHISVMRRLWLLCLRYKIQKKKWCSDEDALNVCPPHSVWRSADSFLANLHDNELRGKFSSEPKDLRIMLVWWGLKENTGIPKEACWYTAVWFKNPVSDKVKRKKNFLQGTSCSEEIVLLLFNSGQYYVSLQIWRQYGSSICKTRAALYLQDVALLDGGMLQLAGLLLQSLSCATDRQTGHYLLWQPEGALTLLYCHHLLLEALHFHQETLMRE